MKYMAPVISNPWIVQTTSLLFLPNPHIFKEIPVSVTPIPFTMSHTAKQSSSVISPMTIMLFSLFFWASASMWILLTAVGVSSVCGTVASFFRNLGKRLTWNFWLVRSAQGVVFCSTISAIEWFSQTLLGVIWQSRKCKYFTTFLRAVHPVFSAFIGFRYFVIHLLITNEVLFLLFVILSSSGRVCFVCRHFLSWFSVLSHHFHCFFRTFPVQSTAGARDILLSSSPHEHVVFQFEGFFSRFFQHQRWTISEPSLARDGHHGIAMAIDTFLGTSWLSVTCTYVSVRARSGLDSKAHRFHNNSEEMLL